MMTLEEAIKHCKDVALSCTNKECALDHFQLLKWLQEYSNMLEKQGGKESVTCPICGWELKNKGEQKPVEPQQDMLSQEQYAKAVDECVYGEQKTDWSEEDENEYNHILKILNIVAKNKKLKVIII